MPISGKVVLVTGPARGIGEETARQLAGRGARLSLVGMEPSGWRRSRPSWARGTPGSSAT